MGDSDGWAKNNINPHRTSYASTGSYYGGKHDYWIPDWDTGNRKRKHEFKAVLLINSTVYDCTHCKRKKEDCKSDYCEDEGKVDDYDTGGW